MNFKSLLFDDTPKQEIPPAAVKPAEPVQQPVRGIPGLPGFNTAPTAAQQQQAYTPQPQQVVADPAMSSGFVEKLRGKYSTSPLYPVIEQFGNAVEAMSEVPEEGSRFRAALKFLQKQSGIDATKLTDAYGSLVAVLDSEAAKFCKALEQQKATEVDTREQEVASINAQIESKNKEIAGLMQNRDQVAGQIVEQKTRLGATQASFEGAQAQLHAELQDALNKLHVYVPVAAPAAASSK